ncbi:MAG TPA: hypothetical protein VFC24_09655 [Casimicrobiaceae bacterium]|nr:hypothetical protein [Casimicrobiaceae bacterium]
MTTFPYALLRRLALVTAVGVALIVSGLWESSPSGVQAAEVAPNSTAAPAANTAPPPASGQAADAENKSDADQHAIIIEKSGRRVRILGSGDKDREYGSLDQLVRHEPELFGMVIAVVAIIFLSPVLLVGVVMLYRTRKTRMLNETLVRLAERGVIAPGEAMQALTTGQVPASATRLAAEGGGVAATSTAPSLLDETKQVRKRAAWSDLRKAVIIGAIGLAFTLHDLTRGRAPDTVGLILLFIGAAYGALWWYETRHLPDRSGTSPPGGGA